MAAVGKKRLTHDAPHKTRPAWSPDGDTIAYAARERDVSNMIEFMTADGNHIKQLSEEHDGSDTDPDWYAPVGWSVPPDTSVVTIWGEIKASSTNRR